MRLSIGEVHDRYDILIVAATEEVPRTAKTPVHSLRRSNQSVRHSQQVRPVQNPGCPLRLLSLVESFHEDMQSTVNFDGTTSASFKIKIGVKQGCVVAATLFCIFFSMLLSYAFKGTLHTL